MEKGLIKQIKEEVISTGNHYKKDMNLTWDGKQFAVKIPKKIAETINIKKGNKMRFHLIPKGDGFELKMELIQDE